MKGNYEAISAKVEREKKIKLEVNKLKRMYRNTPIDVQRDFKKNLEGLIQDAAFIRITSDDVREDILTKGTSEKFVQGSQEFDRERPAVKTYLSLTKQYAAIMKQLIDLLPKEQQEEKKSELLDFMKTSARVVSR